MMEAKIGSLKTAAGRLQAGEVAIVMVALFGMLEMLRDVDFLDLASGVQMAIFWGAVAVVGAVFAAINLALKKRMSADDYAAWQVRNLKTAVFVLLLVLAKFGYLVMLALASLPAANIIAAFAVGLVLSVYLAAGAKINNALKKRTSAEDYAAYIKFLFRGDILIFCFVGFILNIVLMVLEVVFATELSSRHLDRYLDFHLSGMAEAAAVFAAVMIFRALLKKCLTADTYSKLPPMLCFFLISWLYYSVIFSNGGVEALQWFMRL